ncbi:MAG: hypothetical protein GX624_01415 [Actinobacteria bacterium]|nr:hypothetical protein [Actinomycetota bacterium]
MEGLAVIGSKWKRPPRRVAAVHVAAVLFAAATLLLAAPPAAHASEAEAAFSPFVLALGMGLYEQYGYAPSYTRNVPAFDEQGRAYLRSRTASGAETSYVHARQDGVWVRLDFLTALRAAYPSFVKTVGAGGLRSDSLVFDRQGRAYNPISVRLKDGTTRNALLVSWDHCRTWVVFKLPKGTFTTERWVGHNELDGPPFLAFWRTSSPPDLPGSQTNTLWVTRPRLEDGRLVLPPLVKVTDRCLGLSRDSGGATFAVTRGDKTWFVWSETAPPGKGGTPQYVATYDHATGTVKGRRRLVTTVRRSDPHNKPGICLDSSGRLHVIAGGHGAPALYMHSLAPLSADLGWTKPVPVLSTGWASKTDPAVQEGRQTYPAFVCDSRDTLHLVTRQWRRGVDPYHDGRGYGALVHQSCPAGGTWSEPTVVVAGAAPGYSVFFHKLALDARDRLFLSCSYQGGPELKQERAAGAALSVLGRTRLRPGKYRSRMLLVSEDGGATWRFAEDADLEAPGARGVAGRSAASPPAGTSALQATADPSAVAWSWVNPLPQGNQFTGMAFAGRKRGWAVGTHGTILTTSNAGLSWSAQPSPVVADLFDIATAGSTRAWTVGAGGTILRTTDGGRTWRPCVSGTTRDLFSVCAVSTRIVWAVGDRGTILYTRNGGRTWSPSFTSSNVPLFGVSFAGSRHGLIAGGKGVLLYTRNGGDRWKRRRSLSSAPLFSVALLKNGRAVAAGGEGTLVTSTDRGWTWRKARTRTKDALRAVRLVASGRAWAVGQRTVLRSSGRLRRWTARRLPVPGPCGAFAAVSRRTVLAAGAGGAICRSTNAGKTWRSLYKGPRNGWNDMLGAGGEIWAAGAGGALLRAAPDAFVRQKVGDAGLRGIARHGSRGWVVGEGGTIATTVDAGATWSVLTPPTAEDLEAVAAPSADRVVAVGRAGTLLVSDDGGASWRANDMTDVDLLSLTFSDAQHGWAGGGASYGETRAEVLRTTDGGATWQQADLGVWGRVHDLCFIDSSRGWAAVEDWGVDGDRPQGAILATADGGLTWVRQATTAAGLLAVGMTQDGAGWACGEQGLVLQTADAGGTWVACDAGTDVALRTLAVEGGRVWLAGADGAVLCGTTSQDEAPSP